MAAIDPYKEPARLANQRKKESRGPPDLKKPFVRDRKGKKQPEPEPEPEPNEEEEVVDWNDNEQEDDIPPMPGDGEYVEPEQQDIPEPPLSTYVPSADPQPMPVQQPPSYVGELDKQVKLFYTYNLYFNKYLTTMGKYLKYQKGLILEHDEINQAQAKGFIPASQKGNSKQAPSIASDNMVISEDAQKKAKKNAIIKLAMGVMMLGAGAYCAVLAEMPPISIIAIILMAFGGPLFIGSLFK